MKTPEELARDLIQRLRREQAQLRAQAQYFQEALMGAMEERIENGRRIIEDLEARYGLA